MTLRGTSVLNGQNNPTFLMSVNKCDVENRKMLLLEVIWLYPKLVSITENGTTNSGAFERTEYLFGCVE
jgi:hypothetical protein